MRAFPIAQRERSYLISLHSCCCFSFFHFFADKRLFSVGFPKVSPWLWIAIDRCIRTLNSTIRVDVGNSTGFNDPFVLLRYTQNNLESNLCSILISYFFRFELGRVRDRRRGSSFFFLRLAGDKTASFWEGSNILPLRKSNRQYREREYTNSRLFLWSPCKISNR